MGPGYPGEPYWEILNPLEAAIWRAVWHARFKPQIVSNGPAWKPNHKMVPA